jgi:hypothetical protein
MGKTSAAGKARGAAAKAATVKVSTKPAAKAVAVKARPITKAVAKPAAKPAAKQAAKQAAKPAPKPAAKPATKPAAATRTAAKPASKPAAKARSVTAAARVLAKTAPRAGRAPDLDEAGPRPALVRDSFTMPDDEYAVLAAVKGACLQAGFEIKKSELLRIGVALLGQLDVAALRAVLDALPQLKTGRPRAA